MDEMTRSEVAERAGVNPETVRYYERRGLLPAPPRSSAGYRLYDETYVRRLRFIGRAQDLGFTLREIRELLALRSSPEREQHDDAKKSAAAKLAEVEKKIRDLRQIRQALTALVEACSARSPTGDCPILEAMEDENALRTAFDGQPEIDD